ncbi:TIGR03790 family protein [bacterium]|nr:TIGR03790 family protein [bacterium]
MKLLRLLFLVSLLPITVFAQAPVNYDDVGLIINTNDTNSVAIGEYFMLRRDIPQRNVIYIDAPATETITGEKFTDVRAQIEDYLASSGLVDTLNYLVTTKGVPLRVTYGGDLYKPDPRNAAFDAEIMLVLGYFSAHIGRNTLIIPPGSIRTQAYFMKDEHYNRKSIIPGSSPAQPYDMFLTTRLTGLTKEDVFSMIDRSGPFTFVNKDSALFVFDRDPIPITLDPYDNNLGEAGTVVEGFGWNALVNTDSVYVTEQRNVMGYASWGSNDHFDHYFTSHARPQNTWLPGSLAETYVSTSARNFTPGQTGGQSRIADLFAEGCTGASGYVFEPYDIALTWVNVLFNRYLRGYNLAESYYMTNPTISWMATIVGDPKTSIITEYPPLPSPTVSGPDVICEGSNLSLTAADSEEGWMNWFEGDSVSVKAAGPPFDDTHPLWVAEGSDCLLQAGDAGTKTWTFVNENFVGRGFAEFTAEVLPGLQAEITSSADTVYLDTDPEVHFSVSAQGVYSWDWDFGDGGNSSDPSPLHRYTATGEYTVTVEVSNGTCTATAQTTVVVLNSTGTENSRPLAGRIQLLQNYPNPVAPTTAIPFFLPSRMQARITVTDLLGRVVATVLDAEMDGGQHTVLWESDGLEPGTYHCVLEADGQRSIRRLQILR